jgi:hypothetical protein
VALGFSRWVPELIERMGYAKLLNQLNGSSVFTAWNLDGMPDEDREVIEAWMFYQGQRMGSG